MDSAAVKLKLKSLHRHVITMAGVRHLMNCHNAPVYRQVRQVDDRQRPRSTGVDGVKQVQATGRNKLVAELETCAISGVSRKRTYKLVVCLLGPL